MLILLSVSCPILKFWLFLRPVFFFSFVIGVSNVPKCSGNGFFLRLVFLTFFLIAEFLGHVSVITVCLTSQETGHILANCQQSIPLDYQNLISDKVGLGFQFKGIGA